MDPLPSPFRVEGDESAVTGRLQGKVALITGAGSGIGRATARLFASEGAAVAVVDLREDAAKETADAIVEAGGRAVGIAADVTDAEAIGAAVERTVAELGRLDIVYNNAGIGSTGSVADATESDWDLCFAVNVKGTFLTSRAAVPHLDANGGGAIVNQGSVAGLVGVPNFAAYCAAKGAVVALTRSMAIDLAPRDPGQRDLPGHGVHAADGADADGSRRGRHGQGPRDDRRQIPHRPAWAPPRRSRAVALFLASDDASFVTGSTFAADGGMTAA